jgi:hypothetical protein
LLATPQALTAACTIVWPRPPPPVQAGEPIELLLRATDPWGNPVGSLGGATAVLTYEDAKFVSRSATVFIVWLARVFGVVERLEREWHEATLACRKLEGAIDDARHHVEVGCTPSIPGLPLDFTTRMALRVPFEFHVLTSSLTALGMVVSVAGTPRQARSDGS